MEPVTHYAKSGDASVAYQVIGEGPFDLVYVAGWISNIEMMWEEPGHARFLSRLASFSRLLLIDKRGTGLSERLSSGEAPPLEQRADDVRDRVAVVQQVSDVVADQSQRSPVRAVCAHPTHPPRCPQRNAATHLVQ